MNIIWRHANRMDQRKLFCIKRLLIDRPDLVRRIFNSEEPKLRSTTSEILLSTGGMSHEELLLVMLALDIWDGSGGANMQELLEVWGERSWSHFLSALGVFLMDREMNSEVSF